VEHTKAKLRESIRLNRRNNQSHFNLSLLADSEEFHRAGVIASYQAYGDEPNTDSINQLIIESGKKLLLPALMPDRSLEFRIWDGNPKNLKLNGKLREPVGEKFSGAIDLMILPALAIDKHGNRLGQGGGSYDRTLESFEGISIAVVNESEFVESLPTEDRDIPVNAVLTPTRLIRF
jgi:5-formyltetrahydrofolate cyclo-ligase